MIFFNNHKKQKRETLKKEAKMETNKTLKKLNELNKVLRRDDVTFRLGRAMGTVKYK